MSRFFTFATLIFLGWTGFAQSDPLVISGQVTDRESGEALVGVNISIKGISAGAVTEPDGSFRLTSPVAPPLTLEFSYVGFSFVEHIVTDISSHVRVQMRAAPISINEVVVSASRIEESILQSPVAIEKLDLRALKSAPTASFYDAMGYLKGVQMTTSSITFNVPNTRGFNIPNNFRFLQLVDGIDMQAGTLGVPLGNAVGPTELDILSIEVVSGAASALYGMNAINGLANLQTKSPFLHQGLSVYQRLGVNHVDGIDYAPSLLSETAIRYAQAFDDKFAFKVNAAFFTGTDWRAGTLTDQNPQNLSSANPRFPELSGDFNPAYDGWSVYGNERNNNVPVTVQYQGRTETFNVRRTGYLEKDLVPKQVENLKFDAGLYYKLGADTELSYSYRFGQLDGLFQRGNKIQMDDVSVQIHKVELKGDKLLLRLYTSSEDTGDSYNLKPTADNLQLTASSNAQWSNDFSNALQANLDNGIPLAHAFAKARQIADATLFLPGSPEFNSTLATIRSINNWDHASFAAGAPATGGSLLTQRSRIYHGDLQYDLSETLKFFDLLIGADYRLYSVTPDGNNFVDYGRPVDQRTIPDADGSFGENQYYRKYGAFAQVTKLLFDDKLKISLSGRLDHNPEFDPRFNPRFGLVYTVADKHYFRASYQNGFRFPALFEALSFVNNGNVRRVGGLPRVNEGLNYLENSYTLASLENFNAAVNAAVAGGADRTTAALDQRALLIPSKLDATRPERIDAYDLGYKSVLLDNKLSIDFDLYFNQYRGFLGQVEVAVPVGGQVGSDEAVLAMLSRGRQVRYRVFTNALNTYNSYGSALALTYNFHKNFVLSGNVNYNNVNTGDGQDIFITAFNTPRWATNFSLSNRFLTDQLGFNLVWHWQDAFLWESPLVTGRVPAFNTVDAQLSYRLPKQKASVKIGGTNIFNHRYLQYGGGPTIGALYYVALTIEGI